MRFTFKKGVIAALAVGGLIAGTTTASFAASPAIKAGTTVTGKLAKGTTMTFQGTINGVPITVTCKSFVASGKTPAKASDTLKLSAPPAITKCKDSLGGTDTIKTTGSWSLIVASDGSTLTLNIPKKGATFTSSVLKSCTIVAAPTKTFGVEGSYSTSTATDTVSGSEIPVTTSGTCTAADTATTSATVVLSPNPGTPPW
jgi:hypothetical protein